MSNWFYKISIDKELYVYIRGSKCFLYSLNVGIRIDCSDFHFHSDSMSTSAIPTYN